MLLIILSTLTYLTRACTAQGKEFDYLPTLQHIPFISSRFLPQKAAMQIKVPKPGGQCKDIVWRETIVGKLHSSDEPVCMVYRLHLS